MSTYQGLLWVSEAMESDIYRGWLKKIYQPWENIFFLFFCWIFLLPDRALHVGNHSCLLIFFFFNHTGAFWVPVFESEAVLSASVIYVLSRFAPRGNLDFFAEFLLDQSFAIPAEFEGYCYPVTNLTRYKNKLSTMIFPCWKTYFKHSTTCLMFWICIYIYTWLIYIYILYI